MKRVGAFEPGYTVEEYLLASNAQIQSTNGMEAFNYWNEG